MYKTISEAVYAAEFETLTEIHEMLAEMNAIGDISEENYQTAFIDTYLNTLIAVSSYPANLEKPLVITMLSKLDEFAQKNDLKY